MQKAPFLGHSHDGVCTHKDMDHACGCVSCTYCDITMIECDNRKAGTPCEPRVDTQSIDESLQRLVRNEGWGPGLRENRAQFAWRIDEELDRLANIEQRLLDGDDVVIIYPYGRRVRHTL